MSNSTHQDHAGGPLAPENFADQANRCRRLANATYDRDASSLLQRMADDYEQRAKTGSN